MLNFFFGPNGRIGRLHWWLGHFASVAITASFGLWMFTSYGIVDEASAESAPLFLHILANVLSFAILWFACCLTIKRYHDLNRSGWWLLLIFVPVLQIWAIIECGFFSGTVGPNDYGRRGGGFDPKGLHEEIEALREARRQTLNSRKTFFEKMSENETQQARSSESGPVRFGRRGLEQS